MASIDEQFKQATTQWDLETLYTDLASAKGKRLTPVEKLHLRGLLCGYSPTEIAEKLKKNVKGVEVDLCNTLYKYVKNLVDKSDEKMENWRNITEWLEEAGYKNLVSNQFQLSDDSPVDLLVKKANISFDNNKIIVDINLRIVASSSSESIIIENFNTNGKG
ncbi:helix-turn-helix domain-containing protein [Anabaena sp. UHCC 0399]|uniref:helix-turn-helix domain-containing protein n=1 Tax=Anabaena sp. UHCC 0399 TaxID=3110238 RepID=UPI002B1F0271|nr:helix-turn-helix domain-containing protein [Anabaena sp. UHCC 0399]MEA5564871.1 helix-turn-helix domain-containing protein [Anabaena sp. UHCC 0399]